MAKTTTKTSEIPRVKSMDANTAVIIMRKAGLHITPATLRKGIANGQYPFGTCVIGDDGQILNCTIYEKELMEWLASKAS